MRKVRVKKLRKMFRVLSVGKEETQNNHWRRFKKMMRGEKV
jgi:hypothetical protein